MMQMNHYAYTNEIYNNMCLLSCALFMQLYSLHNVDLFHVVISHHNIDPCTAPIPLLLVLSDHVFNISVVLWPPVLLTQFNYASENCLHFFYWFFYWFFSFFLGVLFSVSWCHI